MLRALTFLLPFVSAIAFAAELQPQLEAWLKGSPGAAAVARIDAQGVTFFQAGEPAVTADTQWEIGSITKVFTALLLAESERTGKVKRDDPAANYLLPADDPALTELRKITLLSLTTHRSGLPRLPYNMDSAAAPDPYAGYDAKKLRSALIDHGKVAVINGQTAYSNLGVAILGEALAAAWKSSYENTLQQQILQPLGMNHTTLAMVGSAESKDFAKPLQGPHWTFDAFAPAGALRSSTRELSLFIQACLGFRDTPLNASLKETFKPLCDTTEFAGKIGMGWFITNDPKPVVWHSGATGGFNSFIGFSPANGIGFVVLTNSKKDATELGMQLLGSQPIKAKTFLTENADQFTGSYSLTADLSFIVTASKGELAAELTAQPPVKLSKTAADHFTIVGVPAEISFERDDAGTVTALILHQNGLNQRAPRTAEIPIAAEKLNDYTGEYPLVPGVVTTISASNGKLFAQLTGQPKFPIFASYPDTFFFKVVNAQLKFERNAEGKIAAAILKQNGAENRMTKR